MNLDLLLPDLVPRIAAIRRDIHAHPELAFGEHRTAGVVAEFLEGLGLEVFRGIARTGVVARLVLGSGKGRSIGLRADMDALPLDELNAFDHRSRHEGRMHACGHDGHTALLLGAAAALSRLAGGGELAGCDGIVHFIFQPAEEHEGGGELMVQEGLFQRFPMEKVFGLHNWPGMDTGYFGIMDGPVMAGADRFEIVVTGRGGHAAMPHQATDTIVAASALVQALQTVVARTMDPQDAAVVSVTRFHAGHADNILPEEAVLGGTVRCFRPELQDAIEVAIRRICDGIAAAHGVSIRFNPERGYPPTFNDPEAAALCRAAAAAIVGEDKVHPDLKPSMGAEDFAYLARAVPGCYVWLGNGPGVGGCMLHSPHYDFNDEVIPLGIRYWVALARHCLRADNTEVAA
ncbi:MAG: amidohydrolase [Proteobacteria bacterium]|nr:amidohydrolase [Pseudomonadota bacterium]HQR03293.1 M20 aminoacylase family protein [Rhodocyclaceae bacterium]